MVLNEKRTGRASSIPTGLAMGIAVNTAILLVFAGIVAWLISMEYMEEKQLGYGIMIALIMSSFAGAYVAAEKIKRQRLLICGLSGVLYFMLLLGFTALFFGGQYEAVGVTGGLVIGGSVLAAIAQNKPSRGGKRRRMGKRNR